MPDPHKEEQFQSVLKEAGKVSPSKSIKGLNALLGIDLEDGDYDLEEELSDYLGRPLQKDEIHKLRPIALHIEDNFYGEE